MVTVPQATSPFKYSEPIVNEQGLPTEYFLRKWQELLEVNAANDEATEAVNTILAVQFTAGAGLEGGGTLEDTEIDYALTDTGVLPKEYVLPTITVDAQGRITNITDGSENIFLPTISSYFDGTPEADDIMARYILTKELSFAILFAGSQGFLETVPTAEMIFDIQSNAVSIGTMVFAASSNTATFTGAAVTLSAGDRIAIIAPSTPDDTAANLSFSLQTV